MWGADPLCHAIWGTNRFYFSASGPSIAVHATATSAVVARLRDTTAATPAVTTSTAKSADHHRVSRVADQTIDAQAHAAAITFLGVHPLNPVHLVSAARDGCVKVWDWADGILVKVCGFQTPGLTSG